MLSEQQAMKVFGGRARLAAIDQYIDDLVAAAPPLTNRQRDRIAALIHPAAAVERPVKSPRSPQVAA